MRVALLCEEAAGARVLELLARGAHDLVALLTTEGSPAASLAGKLGLRPWSPRRVREPEFARELAQAGAELLLNVHSLYVVPAPVLQVPRLGAYNLHPGLLPACAGLNGPSWAIYHGWQRHGVTLHRMEAGIDTGAVVLQEEFPVEPRDTGLSLALRCARKGVEMIKQLVEILAADSDGLPQKPQDLAQRRYFGREVPQGGRIDWNTPARRIHDFVRACDYLPFTSPWGTPRATLQGREVEVLRTERTGKRCEALPGSVDGDLVATADEWLRLTKLR